ncbi:MAG: putative RiPP precursor [Bacteroidetes bacterium]|nr:putative RiPP precursor [Bacteroidota bacterium]
MSTLPDVNKASNTKKPYHSPELRHFGSLAELVQNRSARGFDGNPTFIDCTSG